MKKSLLVILGAALLAVGCTKEIEASIDDLTSRVENLEAQVEANKKAIAELKEADFISDVEQTASGWTITLSNGKVLALYNGKTGADGKPGEDGDAFFANVTVEGDCVVFDLLNGAHFTVPFKQSFALVLETRDIVAKKAGEVKIPYTLIGNAADAEVYALASNYYSAEIVGNEVVVIVPEGTPAGHVIVFADNNHGLTSIKSIDFGPQVVEVGKVSGTAFFWGGDVTFPIVSNVDVTCEVEEGCAWLHVKEVKAATTKTVTVHADATPASYVRTANVLVKDADGVTVQTVAISQAGTPKMMIGNNSYSTFADAIKAGEQMSEETITINISEGYIDEIAYIPATSTKKWYITRRWGGVPYPAIENCQFAGVETNNPNVMVGYVSIKPNATTNKAARTLAEGGNNSGGFDNTNYPFGACVEPDGAIYFLGVTFFGTEEFKGAQGTMYVDFGDGSKFEDCTFEGGAARIGQVWGKNITFNNCDFRNGYSSYAVRQYATSTVTVKGGSVDTPVFIDAKNPAAGWSLTIDENTAFTPTVTKIVNGPASLPEGCTMSPMEYYNAAPTKTVDIKLDGVPVGSLWAATAKAKAGSVIELAADTYYSNVKVASDKDFTIKGAGKLATTIYGNIEIAGKVTLKDLTLASAKDYTNNALTVKVDGDAYDWGHYYLARVENGAHDVTIENVRLLATDNTDDNFKNTMSMLWVSQAQNVFVKDVDFVTAADASYCGNQTHQASVKFENCTFNNGGRKEFALRAMDTDDMTVEGCEFHSKVAIEVYSDFVGSLTLGNGSMDDNKYGTEVEKAVAGEKDGRVAAGAHFYPETMVFNATGTEQGAGFYSMWKVQLDEIGVADARNFTFDGANVVAGCTGAGTPMVALRGGQKVGEFAWNADWKNGFTGARTGLTTVKNGTKTEVIVCNVASAGNTWAPENLEFCVYHYSDMSKAEKVLSYKFDQSTVERMGDYLSFKGTWQDGQILVAAANNSAKYAYSFAVKEGVVSQEPTLLTYAEDVRLAKSGTCGLFYYKDDMYVITNEGKSPLLVKLVGTEFQLIAVIDCKSILSEANVNTDLRTPKFFTLNGKEYVVGLFGLYKASNFANAKIAVIPTENLKIEGNVCTIATEGIETYETTPGATTSGNGFSGLDIFVGDASVFIGYGVRHGECGLLKFRNQ